MRLIIFLLAFIFFSPSSYANESVKCFEKAWGHPGDGGLGLHRGGAIELCQDATKANEITKCYQKAWRHPADGGLGLHRAGAIELCKKATK